VKAKVYNGGVVTTLANSRCRSHAQVLIRFCAFHLDPWRLYAAVCVVHAACSFRQSTKQETNIMQTVLRRYSGKGAKELFDLLEQHAANVEALMRTVNGFVSYTLARSGDGGFSVTICNDKAGVDESVLKAKDWIANNAGSTGASAPEVTAGSVILHVK
jgi:hypothetical protein